MGTRRKSKIQSSGRRLTFGSALKLLPALVLSAYLMALAVGSGQHPWVGLVTLLPLLRAIQVLRPGSALLCGSVWGVSLFGFAALGSEPVISPGVFSLLLLTLIPGIYAFAGAWATRRVGFSPLVLSAGWILVEFALRPLALRYGLLTPAQDGLLVGVIGHIFGYVMMAFFAAFASAWLLAVLSRISFRLPRPVTHLGLGGPGLRLWHLIPSRIPCFVERPSNPRAPPVA